MIKELLGVHCKTLNVACRSELGRLPINTKIIMASIKYLDHLITSEMSLVHGIFLETLNHNPWPAWVKYMVKCFQSLGFPYLNLSYFNTCTSFKPLFNQLQQRINDQHMQQQNTIISESSKLSFYREFYEFGKRASYVDELTNRNDRSHLAKLRLSAHSLEIERGRYS